MNRLICVLVSSALVGSLAVTAQPPGGGRGGPGGPQQGQRGQGSQQGRGPGGFQQGGGPGGGGPGGQHGGPPPNPVMEALDVDRDHVISAREMANATASLKKLDKNRDGKLTSDEMHPEGGHGGPGGQMGNRGPGGPPGQGGPGGGRGGPPGQGGGHGGPGGPPTKEKFMDHAMTFDVDKDGKLNRSELEKMATALVAEMNNRGPGGQGGPGQSNDRGNRQRPAIEE